MTDAAVRPEYVPTEWETVPCLFCGATAADPYQRFGYRLRFSYVVCRDCGLVYQSPRPKYGPEFLAAAYGDYFRMDEVPDLAAMRGGREDRGWRAEMAEIAEFDPVRSGLLDVGCCMGEFLYVARDWYPRVAGVEVSSRMAAFTRGALGITVWEEPFERLETTERFSCIHLSHVLEHVPDPGAWMRQARRLLAPGGVVVVNIPHAYSLDRRVKRWLQQIGLRRGDWRESWRTPDHLFEPTIPSMRRFLLGLGFEILSCYTYSRGDTTARNLTGRLYRRRLKLGSNLRWYLRPAAGR